MGTLALAAKVTHVPSLYLSELPGPHHGCRQAAIDGHFELGRRCKALGVDTVVVFDVHWLVNAGYHVNCAPRFKGVYTSNELPHFIKNMPFEYDGNPRLGHLIAETATEMGVPTRAHDATTLDLEYGTLVPMRYMNADRHFKVVSVSALCTVHYLNDSARLGWAMKKWSPQRTAPRRPTPAGGEPPGPARRREPPAGSPGSAGGNAGPRWPELDPAP